jgi:hypothetical protein
VITNKSRSTLVQRGMFLSRLPRQRYELHQVGHQYVCKCLFSTHLLTLHRNLDCTSTLSIQQVYTQTAVCHMCIGIYLMFTFSFNVNYSPQQCTCYTSASHSSTEMMLNSKTFVCRLCIPECHLSSCVHMMITDRLEVNYLFYEFLKN